VIVIGLATAIVWTPAPGMLNAISSSPGLPFASRTAWRSEPAPESAVVVTVNVVADAAETIAPKQTRSAIRGDQFVEV
jgi:hypothetical protein